MFVFPDQSEILFGMHFSDERLTVVFADGKPRDSYCGYVPDFTVRTDYQFLANWIDRFGGINLTANDTETRYTGIQIVELFSEITASQNQLSEILTQHLYQIASFGMTGQDFVFLIENTETDLTVPDCFDWQNHLPGLCRNASFFFCDPPLENIE
ncbi:MAG: hypothetical protein IKI29_02965 [Clostridia bacterium]|nr:hypothetical protein [Clostridia bacterium]